MKYKTIDTAIKLKDKKLAFKTSADILNVHFEDSIKYDNLFITVFSKSWYI